MASLYRADAKRMTTTKTILSLLPFSTSDVHPKIPYIGHKVVDCHLLLQVGKPCHYP